MKKDEAVKDQESLKKNSLATRHKDASDAVKARKERAAPFKVKKDNNGVATNVAGGKELDLQICRTFGTTDQGCGLALLGQVTASHPLYTSDKTVEIINEITPLLHGIAPKDELEGMLATQAVAVHNLAMEMARRAVLNSSNSITVDSCINRLTKLNRTFTSQMEALGKYRNRGKQKMVVEHVHVYQGGQAIVGEVNRGARGEDDR